ncbi:metal-sensitive transcriptional regulator [Orenia marismortui]|uniref:DNA-binding FrmR family transcriptional regulator n=1 Tax=Orenia marismortui TaxID=46469 RepID=A0A4R8H002_9FIRM|nr:metal-sensitive transcriptional regulator [Orenia marismortui]TDX52505.1 DNA-binding FrmR family transcriptional regulator [Orenia marismortui]
MVSYKSEKDQLINRLKRVEGQVRGLQRMIDDEKYCVDVLTQIAAVKGALNKVGMNILEKHTHGCVKHAVSNEEGDKIINELMDVIFKFTK